MPPTSETEASRTPTPAPLRRRCLFCLMLLVLLVVAWLSAGFYTVAPNERGIVTHFGAVPDDIRKIPIEPGIHWAWPWPIDEVNTPRSKERKRIEVGYTFLGDKSSLPRRSDMLTGDENILKILMVVQYEIRDPAAYLFLSEGPDWLVERTVESVMNECVAALPVDEVLTTAKGAIQRDVIQRSQGLLDRYGTGIRLIAGNLQDVSPPAPVLDAFNEVASAKKDKERMIDEAHEYAGKIKPQAEGQALAMIRLAEGEREDRVNVAKGDTALFLSVLQEYRKARRVTRTRLYLDAIERVFSKAHLVILDDSGDSKLSIIE